MRIQNAVLYTATLVVLAQAQAQPTKGPTQVVKLPVAQAWIDVATFSGFGMPAMGPGGAGGPSPMSMLGGMMGGGAQSARNAFGNTQTSSAGRWVDVTLFTSRNPALAEAAQAVPAGSQLAPTLKLIAPKIDRPAPAPSDDVVEPPPFERPRGRMHMYWGCGETVRAGQPRTIDFATAKPEELAKFFVSRRATQRGTHVANGRPVWPNEADARMVPADATLVGEHGFSGQGVPEGFRFVIPAAQDLMPAVALKQLDVNGATQLEWAAVPTARAYFVAAMGAKGGMSGGATADMVFWTSSDVPETGTGLVDYQTNAAVDRWLQEKVLLAPSVTRCMVPKGIFGEAGGAMLRLIAYGSELNLAHPPRPADPKVAWEPQWAVKVRVKSVASAMLGIDMGSMPSAASATARPGDTPQQAEAEAEEKKVDPVNILRGIFGR
jgi:hypothetical protein